MMCENREYTRLDQYLFQTQQVKSRTNAADLIKKGLVLVNGKVIYKPSYLVSEDDQIQLQQMQYVSRAGDKLAFANETLQINFQDKIVLDIGASTGGFTDYAIQNGAQKVYALDVGQGQLAESLLKNPRVVNYEKTNLKTLPLIQFAEKIDLVLCDVSFISLEYVFRAVQCLGNEPIFLFLIKPQFEIGDQVIRHFHGYVPDKFLDKVVNKVIQTAKNSGFILQKLVPSAVLGKKLKNQEFFGLFSKT